MTAILRELTVIGIALLVTAAAVWGLGDRGVLVPPPETVAQEFVLEVSLERWEPARTYLAEPVARRVGPDGLRAFLEALERRVGRIESAKGRPLSATDTAARAAVELKSAGGSRWTLRLPLVREYGLWKISDGQWAAASST